jgi:hypothetical protein
MQDGGGRYKLYLKPRSDGSAANDADVKHWAKSYPIQSPFVTDEPAQISYRTTPGMGGKGGMGGKPYAMIIKPRCGKGNVTVYLRTGQVQINCAENVVKSFMIMVEAWTTMEPF